MQGFWAPKNMRWARAAAPAAPAPTTSLNSGMLNATMRVRALQRRRAAACRSTSGDSFRQAVGQQPPSSSGWRAPQKTYASFETDPMMPNTVYTIRFETARVPGAGLSEPSSAVSVVLLGHADVSVTHRVAPINDPSVTHHDMARIIQVLGERAPGAGVNRSATQTVSSTALAEPEAAVSGSSSSSQAAGEASSHPPFLKARFQPGSVDEVSFLAPDIGSLTGVVVSLESGSWLLEEVSVCSSRSNHTDFFICRRRLSDGAPVFLSC